ncbi:MAG: amino acid ABC transporter permease [Propionicimonas sp.]|uniref:amino acid ABC transporter permease n=1 Tax=Propionicimonas sp. TaxID=1955623 RepID=UPI002B2026A5|nr:amino acid ABC transporter permease [Propionicimonas sp.]MEA4944856.1 amino acid ABC transporter permease [Propionicimonas sp.]MEA5052295.1 amino acid ABC transporter permease [Propionicimonas sp.]MEA5119389.1 amino acid ABC transporter permease [Propionicimonas sp.]
MALPEGPGEQGIHPRLGPRLFTVTTALVVLVVLGAALSLVLTSGNLKFSVIGEYLFSPLMLAGVGTTLLITVVSLISSIVLGTALATMRMSKNVVLRTISAAYIWFFRGTPVLVQVIFWFNLALFLPRVGIGSWSVSTNSLVTPMNAALLAMSLNVSAFMCEVIRGGLISVDSGQTEAALSMGMRPGAALLRIILPQAVRVILPPAGNLAIDLLKATSLVYVIGTKEILGTVQSISSQNFHVIELLIVACIWYLALVTVASYFQGRLERRFGRGYVPQKAKRPASGSPAAEEVA